MRSVPDLGSLRDPYNPLGLTYDQRLEDARERDRQAAGIRHAPFWARLLADVEREEEQADPDD